MMLPPNLPRETRTLQHLREGTNTDHQALQDVDPLLVLDLIQTENNKNTSDHCISLLEKTIVTPRFWVMKPLQNKSLA